MADVYDFSVLVEEANILAKEAVGAVLEGKVYQSSKVRFGRPRGAACM